MNSEFYENMLDTLCVESPWSSTNENALLEPYAYITANPGKEIRAMMIAAFNSWLNVPEDKLKVVSKLVNMLHSASLMIDDIEDDSVLRRGQPVTHKIFGIPQTINTANYVYFLAYQELFQLRQSVEESTPPSPGSRRLVDDKDLDRIVTEELLSLHRGQGLELLWRDSLQCPTEEEYVGMVNNKTGGLFRIAIKLMMACATTNINVDYIPLVNLIGVYFQIRDDYMNLQSTEYNSNKGFAEDLTEAKFSFPIIHGIQSDRTNRRILSVLQKRPASPTLKLHTINYLRDTTKSFDYTIQVMKTLERQTLEEIERLGGNPGLLHIMKMLHVEDPSPQGDQKEE